MKNKSQTKEQNSNQDSQSITSFHGYYSFLSNDYPSWVLFDQILFPSVTTAFQGARADSSTLRKRISLIEEVDEFKKVVMEIKNPKDWNEQKYSIMLNLIRDKFKRNKELGEKLIGTKNKKIINTLNSKGYNEEYWGIVDGVGKNALGKILMTVRDEFFRGDDTKNWIQTFKLEKDEEMFPKVHLLVEKDGKKIDKLFLDKKSYFLFGKSKGADFLLENPTISRFHSCIYFSSETEVMLIDMNSTHGTYLNKNKLESLIQYRLNKGDVIRFGTSERNYTIDIDWSQIQQNLRKAEKELKVEIESNSYQIDKEANLLEKREMRNALGIQKTCLFIQGKQSQLSQMENHVKDEEKIKKVRKVIGRHSAKTEGLILYFRNHEQAEEFWKDRLKFGDRIKIKKMNLTEAQQTLNRNRNEGTEERQRSRGLKKYDS